ncbi:MAG: heme exporter protein CcmD [Micavibrio sp.]|nr:heme exporter protein CcmD [Micavibrio sp.]
MTGQYASYIMAAYAIAAIVLTAITAQSWLACKAAEKAAAEGTGNNGDA